MLICLTKDCVAVSLLDNEAKLRFSASILRDQEFENMVLRLKYPELQA